MKAVRAFARLTAAQGLRVLSRLDVPPVKYVLRVAGTDGSGKSQWPVWSAVLYGLDVPDFAKDPITMSGLALSLASEAGQLTTGPDKDWQKRFDYAPTARRAFSAADELTVAGEAYINEKAPGAIEATTTGAASDRGSRRPDEGPAGRRWTFCRVSLRIDRGAVRAAARRLHLQGGSAQRRGRCILGDSYRRGRRADDARASATTSTEALAWRRAQARRRVCRGVFKKGVGTRGGGDLRAGCGREPASGTEVGLSARAAPGVGPSRGVPRCLRGRRPAGARSGGASHPALSDPVQIPVAGGGDRRRERALQHREHREDDEHADAAARVPRGRRAERLRVQENHRFEALAGIKNGKPWRPLRRPGERVGHRVSGNGKGDGHPQSAGAKYLFVWPVLDRSAVQAIFS